MRTLHCLVCDITLGNMIFYDKELDIDNKNAYLLEQQISIFFLQHT
jgi:hypothetical protein